MVAPPPARIRPYPHTRCNPIALTPFFWLVIHQIARNHTGKAMRVPSKIVPAVTVVW